MGRYSPTNAAIHTQLGEGDREGIMSIINTLENGQRLGLLIIRQVLLHEYDGLHIDLFDVIFII